MQVRGTNGKANGAHGPSRVSSFRQLQRHSVADYFATVQLLVHDERAYARIWDALYNAGFRRCIRGQEGLYRLPQGVFKVATIDGESWVHEQVEAALRGCDLLGSVFVVRADSISWVGLELDEEVAIREMVRASASLEGRHAP